MNLITSLMQLHNVIDEETKTLFGQFCLAALGSGNPNHFVKRALRRSLEPDEPPATPEPIQATVVEVKATETHMSRQPTKRTRK